MPQIMSLEGPHLGASVMRMGRSGPQVSALHGFWSDVWDGISSAGGAAASGASDAWSSVFDARTQRWVRVRKGKTLSGALDPITTRPWVVVGGIILGMWLAGSERGKKLTKSYGFGGARRRRRR